MELRAKRLVIHLMAIAFARARQALVTTPRGKFADAIKGISWGPVPLKGLPMPSSPIPQDDWMVLEAKPMWSERGRGDLRVMRQMGANLVRLYGNVAEAPHLNFLDEASRNDLKIVPGLSDWPFTQMPRSCRETGWDCYNQIKDSYRNNLEGGFLVPTEDGQHRKYHEAIQYMIVINEPDLKTPPDATSNAAAMRLMARAIVSAVDAMLDAERDAGVVGPAPMFTVTMSFANCPNCDKYQPWEMPAMNQFVFLEEAMLNPEESVGYRQNNDLASFYRTRWLHGANTQNNVPELRNIGILSAYTQRFPQIPLWIGEYHKPGSSIQSDLTAALQLSNEFPLLWGISFFQYQKAYWKGGTEEEFGAWALGSHVISTISYFGTNFNIYCLEEVIENGHNIPREITNAFGGSYVQVSDLCRPNPEQVQISEAGFSTIRGQQDADKLAVFVERVVNRIGFNVRSQSELEQYAKELLSNPASDMDTIIQDVVQRPWWVAEDCEAVCIADRDALVEQITGAIDFGCGYGAEYCGNNIPPACRDDIFYKADWILSNYYANIGANPLENCYAGGAAIYAPRSKQPYNLRPECIKKQVVNAGCQDGGSWSGGGSSGLYGVTERVTVDRGSSVRSSLNYVCNTALCEVVCDDTKGCNSFIFSPRDCVCFFMDKCVVNENERIVGQNAVDHHYQTYYKKECVASVATSRRWPTVTVLIPVGMELLRLLQICP